jgi:hypothetical protein
VFPGALLKAALLCAKIVEFPSEVPLEVQLAEKYGGGFELASWSNLPHGSGIFTVLLLCLWVSCGFKTFSFFISAFATSTVYICL